MDPRTPSVARSRVSRWPIWPPPARSVWPPPGIRAVFTEFGLDQQVSQRLPKQPGYVSDETRGQFGRLLHGQFGRPRCEQFGRLHTEHLARPVTRKFWEAAITKDPVAREGLARIARIFELDRSWRKQPASEIKALRDAHLRAHTDDFFAWVAVGRKNWLFVGSDDHAQAAGNLLTLIASARLHGLDPEAYLRDLFPRAAVLAPGPLPRAVPTRLVATRARLDPVELERELGPIVVAEPTSSSTEQASAG